MKGFLNKGDVVRLKPHFLVEYNIPSEYRDAIIKYHDGCMTTLLIGEGTLTGHFDVLKDFHMAESINSELYGLLENGIQFTSFKGMTLDGREIEIKL